MIIKVHACTEIQTHISVKHQNTKLRKKRKQKEEKIASIHKHYKFQNCVYFNTFLYLLIPYYLSPPLLFGFMNSAFNNHNIILGQTSTNLNYDGILLVESQKGIIGIQSCYVDNHKDAIAVQSLWK